MTAPMTASLPILAAPGVSARTSGLVIAIGSALAFSSSGPFMKPLLEAGWSLTSVLLVRMAVAGLILSPALVGAIRADQGMVRRNARLILGFGVTGVAGCQLFFFAAMQRMPVAVALLVQYLAPVLLVLLAWLRTRRAPSRRVLAGSLVAMLGLVLVVDIAGARFDLVGVLFALGAAVCLAAYFLVAERAADDLSPLALASGGLFTGALLMAAIGVAGLIPFAAPAVDVVVAGLEVAWWMPLVWVAAVATTVGYALGILAVPRIGSRVASFVGLTEVLFALGFAWLLLGEAPAPVQYLGGVLILVGVVLVRSDRTSAGEPTGEAARLPSVPSPS